MDRLIFSFLSIAIAAALGGFAGGHIVVDRTAAGAKSRTEARNVTGARSMTGARGQVGVIGTGSATRTSGTNNLVEVRSGDWPISLESVRENSHTFYFLEFRDQQVVRAVVMDTLPFPDLQQLKYFGKALSALKTGTNGDIARFKDYTITRAEKKYEGTWFLLKYQWGSTDFKQPEADIIINTIRGM
jgi:hypothetical protein